MEVINSQVSLVENRVKFTRTAVGVAISMALAVSSYSAHASCTYTVVNQWGTGFQGSVTVENDTQTALNGWELNWEYSGSNRISNSWNVSLSGNNPYIAKSLAYNGNLQPGESTSFGFQGTGDGSAEVPNIDGTACEPFVVVPPPPVEPVTPVVFRVNEEGKITKDDIVSPVQCGAWFGLEGRHEPSDDPDNPSGAPMELYVGNTFWANGNQGTGRTMQQTMTEIKGRGINTIRVPISPQTLKTDDPQGVAEVFKNHISVREENSRQALEGFIKLADENELDVILDIHSCSNFLGWRAGRLDAKPPYADKDRDNYDYVREDYSCNPAVGEGVTVHAYNEELWLADLRELAGLSESLNVNNILGIDIFNEPWDYTWSEWKTLSEHAYEAINEVDPNVLIFVEGIGSVKSDGVLVEHGDLETNPNWGENFYSMATDPLDIPKERLVLSPHIYGPSVSVQRQFMDPEQPECTGLEADVAGDAGCNIVINPPLLEKGWDEHFGYLKEQGYAIVVGEFGGHFDWPAVAPIRDQDRWAHITPGVDKVWQEAAVAYMKKQKIQACYWSMNPESDDTGGLYSHAYDPRSNSAGWGEWTGYEEEKWSLLEDLWDQ